MNRIVLSLALFASVCCLSFQGTLQAKARAQTAGYCSTMTGLKSGRSPGSSIRGVNRNGKTLAQCEADCLARHRCKAITYWASAQVCYLLDRTYNSKYIPNTEGQDCIVANKRATPVCFSGEAKGPSVGNAIAHMNYNSKAQCYESCAQNGSCLSVVIQPYTKVCYLLDGTTSTTILGPSVSNKVSGGFTAPVEGRSPGGNTGLGRLDDVNLATCQNRCTGQPTCQAIVFWNTDNGSGTCHPLNRQYDQNYIKDPVLVAHKQ